MKYPMTMLMVLLTAASVFAGQPEVVAVRIEPTGNAKYIFHVTVRHGDTGWKHYADKWEVVAPNGKVLGTRVLAHPHVNEQPFTRSLSGVQIPPGIRQVRIRVHDSVHGYGSDSQPIRLPD